jgi:hypothetical protein
MPKQAAIVSKTTNRIYGFIMADAEVDKIPEGWPEDAQMIDAPEKAGALWRYDPVLGFLPPAPQKVEF